MERFLYDKQTTSICYKQNAVSNFSPLRLRSFHFCLNAAGQAIECIYAICSFKKCNTRSFGFVLVCIGTLNLLKVHPERLTAYRLPNKCNAIVLLNADAGPTTVSEFLHIFNNSFSTFCKAY